MYISLTVLHSSETKSETATQLVSLQERRDSAEMEMASLPNPQHAAAPGKPERPHASQRQAELPRYPVRTKVVSCVSNLKKSLYNRRTSFITWLTRP